MDRLSELLSSVRVRTASWSVLDTSAAFTSKRRPSTFWVHHVVRGSARVTVGGEALVVRAVVVVPHGHAHTITDHEDVTSVCLELEDPFSAPVVSSLPAVFALEGPGPAHAALVEQLSGGRRELESKALGADLALARMADVLFVQVMRAHVETIVEPASHSCRALEHVSALRDPSVATALALMSREPAHAWTVASLAERAGLSRSSFAARFTTLVGETPLSFLTRMRMQKATALLREGATLAMTSELTGYSSEGSFSHAFRQWSGMSPGAYRRQHQGTST